jgi:3-methylcrotonyl-CoA carboxylase alpha subunit
MVLEAMKMEHAIQASHAGEISEVYFALNDQVEEGAVLLAFKE